MNPDRDFPQNKGSSPGENSRRTNEDPMNATNCWSKSGEGNKKKMRKDRRTIDNGTRVSDFFVAMTTLPKTVGDAILEKCCNLAVISNNKSFYGLIRKDCRGASLSPQRFP